MNATTLFLCMLLAIAQVTLPRKWAIIPLIIVACYFPRVARIDIGPLSFTAVRILAVFVTLRIIARGEMIKGGLNGLDKIIIAWTIWLLLSTIFTISPIDSLIFRLGKLSDTAVLYFAIRCLCVSKEDTLNVIKFIAFALIPISLEMIQEKLIQFNSFSILGGNPFVMLRDGKFRARGPFAHAILAGTVGGTCFPLILSIYKTNKILSIFGATACIIMVVASASSGPLMALFFSLFALVMWKKRNLVPLLLKLSLFVYVVLEFTMTRPPYFIIGMIDLTGSSTGYHRAALIESAFAHLGEWWFAGTEYTRHWMPTGVSWSPNHTDITNHFIAQGVSGGLLQFFLYIGCFVTTFRYIGKLIKLEYFTIKEKFMLWAIGSSLFAHAGSQISVSYYDQSVLFIYLIFAVVSSLYFYGKQEPVKLANDV